MHKKFDINRSKIKGGCQSGRKLVTHDSKSDLPLQIKTFLFKARNEILNKISLPFYTFPIDLF